MVAADAAGDPSTSKLEFILVLEEAAGFTDAAPGVRRNGLLEPNGCPLEDMVNHSSRVKIGDGECVAFPRRAEPMS